MEEDCGGQLCKHLADDGVSSLYVGCASDISQTALFRSTPWALCRVKSATCPAIGFTVLCFVV